MQSIGIIANPDSGKDIRRLTAPASVFDDREKINVLKRILMTLDAMEVRRVTMMPDSLGLSRAALRDAGPHLQTLQAEILGLPAVHGDERDSGNAAQAMRNRGCACIITLGGDGTNRVVAAHCGDTPLLPLSAGTNNVFPYLVEATTAALAAAAFAREAVNIDDCCRQRPLLELYRGEEYLDVALIDVVVVDLPHIGAGAVWNPEVIRELFLARARPGDIGLSSIGAGLQPMPLDSGMGMHIRTGGSGRRVMAPLSPGTMHTVRVSDYRLFGADETVPVAFKGGVIALDGERGVAVDADDSFGVKLRLRGPRVIDIETTLTAAIDNGFLAPPADG